MTAPRVRITVGKLLFAILIVALNCGVARRLYPALEPPTFEESIDPWLEAMVGLWLLSNAVIVGAAALLARKLNSFRRKPSIDTRRPACGFTFLSAHFLALGCLTCFLMPGVFWAYREYLQPISNYVEGIASRFISANSNSDAWLVLQHAMLGVFVSGPPLLLSCVGGIVANRYVAALPRRRFWALTLLVSLGFAGTGLAVAVTPQPFHEYYYKVDIEFQVVNRESGEPIGTTFILIRDAFHSFITPVRALTGPGGRARLTPSVFAFGKRNAFRAMGLFETWGHWLEISAPGYQTRRVSLTEILGPLVDLEDPRVWRVALARGDASDESFGDVAGDYLGFTIERDGRFTYHLLGGCFGPSHEEYGYLKRMGNEFVLFPVARPGKEVDPAMEASLRAIPWGDRVYLCTTNASAR